MFDSSVIDVGIGLVFVFLLLSTAVTAAKEGLEALYKRRGQYLEKGIKELVGWVDAAANDPKSPEAKLVSSLYEHPFINSLFAGPYDPTKKANLPSYIPAANFALALYDLRDQSLTTPSIVLPDKVQKAFAAIEKMVGNDKERVLKAIEEWYDSSMDRVSGWYKRHTQWWIFAIAVVITIGVNADSILIARRLSTDKTLRSAAVEAAQKATSDKTAPPVQLPLQSTTSVPAPTPVTGGATPPVATVNEPDAVQQSLDTIKNSVSRLDGVGFPIGWGADISEWETEHKPAKFSVTNYRSVGGLVKRSYSHFAGWAITILAIMLGAPFWFDVLNKFMVVRSTVKPAEKSGEEKSKDPGPVKPPATQTVQKEM